jgi:hypothetical protein
MRLIELIPAFPIQFNITSEEILDDLSYGAGPERR